MLKFFFIEAVLRLLGILFLLIQIFFFVEKSLLVSAILKVPVHI
jgi:hypothetical protein